MNKINIHFQSYSQTKRILIFCLFVGSREQTEHPFQGPNPIRNPEQTRSLKTSIRLSVLGAEVGLEWHDGDGDVLGRLAAQGVGGVGQLHGRAGVRGPRQHGALPLQHGRHRLQQFVEPER